MTYYTYYNFFVFLYLSSSVSIILRACLHRFMIFQFSMAMHSPNRNEQFKRWRATFWAFNRFIRTRYLGEIDTIAIIYTVCNRRLHTSCMRLAYLYAACSLYTLNGKWHTHVAKRWSIGWYNPHVTTYTAEIHALRMHIVSEAHVYTSLIDKLILIAVMSAITIQYHGD